MEDEGGRGSNGRGQHVDYVEGVLRRWLMIVGLGLLAGVVALGVGFLSPTIYEAVAGVVVVKEKVDLVIEPKYETLSEEDLSTRQGVDAATRREAFSALVKNGAIAVRVIEQLGEALAVGERDVGRLLGMVTGRIRPKSDLIEIRVRSQDPDKAALIANSWGKEYERYVNAIYSGAPESYAGMKQQSESAKATYDKAEVALTAFIAQNRIDDLNRQIEEKEEIIASLQSGRQTAVKTVIHEQMKAQTQIIAAYLDAEATNRLVVFSEEQQAKRELISRLIDAETDAHLVAFEKDREARSELFVQYVDAEIENRLRALAKEQEAKSQLFSAYVDADTRAKETVFKAQVEARVQTLAGYYQTRLKLEQLLADAKALKAQAEQGGEAGSASNSLAILLLKAEAYASSAELPGNLQIQLDGVSGWDAGAGGQADDLGALTAVLGMWLEDLDGAIIQLSEDMFNNQGYDLLSAKRPDDDPLYAALKKKYEELFEVGDLARAADSIYGQGTLSQAIMDKYEELFGLGPLATASGVVSTTTPLFAAIKLQYPELFAIGDLSQLTENVPSDNPLAIASSNRVEELLQLRGMETVLGHALESEALAQAISDLQDEVQQVRAEVAQESSRERELMRARDLAWESYEVVTRKAAELDIDAQTVGSEVRFALPAVPLRAHGVTSGLQSAIVAGLVGLLIGVAAALGLEYLATQRSRAES